MLKFWAVIEVFLRRLGLTTQVGNGPGIPSQLSSSPGIYSVYRVNYRIPSGLFTFSLLQNYLLSLPCFEHVHLSLLLSYALFFTGEDSRDADFVPLWKVLRVWFICLNLALLGVCYLIPSYMFYLLEWDKSLSMCGFIHLLCSIVFSSFDELCCINHVLICFFGSCACMFTKCISYTILCFVWSII